MNTIEEKRANIMALQYKHSLLASTLATALSNNKCAECLLDKNAAITMAINVVRRYEVFEATITNAYEIEIISEGSGSTIFEIIVDSVQLAIYKGTDDPIEIAEGLAAGINAGTETTGYIAIVEGSKIFLYTFSETANFTHVPVVNITEQDPSEDNRAVVTSLESSLGAILNDLNCITSEQLCAIRSYIKSFINTLI